MPSPSLSDRSTSPFQVMPILIGAVLLAVGLTASWIGPLMLSAVVAVLAVASSYELIDVLRSRLPITASLVVCAACAALPIVTLYRGEAALLLTIAIAVVALAATFVIVGTRPEAIRSFGLGVTSILYVGALSSYLTLIRTLSVGAPLRAGPVRYEPGVRFLIALCLMIVAYRAGSVLATTRLPRRAVAPDLPSGAHITWGGFAGGFAGCILAVAVSSLFLHQIFGVATLALLGAVVAFSCLMGDLSVALLLGIGAGGPVTGASLRPKIFPKMAPFLFAAPALFYAFRLYLT